MPPTPPQARKASKNLAHLKSPSNPDAILAFLAGLGLSPKEVAAAVASNPRILCARIDLSLAPISAELLLPSWAPGRDLCGGRGGVGGFEGVACDGLGGVANVSLQGKGLAGTLSPAVAGLRSHTGLYLHYNALRGGVPLELANLTQLTDLYLDVNNFSGPIPPEIAAMASLQVVQLCYNQLTESIPTQLGLLKRLTVLALQSNHLIGAIPASLGNLPLLVLLDLSFNDLFGSIPVRLDVRNNSFTGSVPSASLNIFEYSMSGKPSNDTTGQLRPEGDTSDEKVETANENEGDVMPSPQEEINPFAQWDLTEYLQEAAIKKKYGGIVPRKPPLISKDHERAYFDSADWALGKQGGNPQKPKGPLEALRPKLQPTQQQARSRRFPYASADNEEGVNSPTEF